MRQCVARAPLPTAPRQSDSVLHESNCPQPLGSEAVRCRSTTAHCPQAMSQCVAGVPLPTTPGQCGSALHESNCSLPPGSEAVHCKGSTAHCP